MSQWNEYSYDYEETGAARESYNTSYTDASSPVNMQLWASCLATFYIVITIIGISANAAVLYIIIRSRRSKAVTSIYIFNLAIADLLYLICLPAAVYPMLNGHWILGRVMCKLYFTCDGVSKFASVMFLVVLSFDRYFAVCHPIGSRVVRTAKVAFFAVALSWLIVIVGMVPVFFYATLVTVRADGGNSSLQCVIYWPPPIQVRQESVNTTEPSPMDHTNTTVMSDWADQNETIHSTVFVTPETDWQRRIFTLYLFALSFSLPLLMVWVFYVMILHRLWAQKRNLCRQSSSTKSQRALLPSNKAIQRRRRSTKRVTIMVLSIVVAYTLCWIPYWCVQMTIEFFREHPALDFETFTVVSYIAYGIQSVNSALNPFLYAFGTHSHRRRFLHWLTRLITICRRGTGRLQQVVDENSYSLTTGARAMTAGSRRRELAYPRCPGKIIKFADSEDNTTNVKKTAL